MIWLIRHSGGGNFITMIHKVISQVTHQMYYPYGGSENSEKGC